MFVIIITSHQGCRTSLATNVPEEQGDRATLWRGSGVPTFSLAADCSVATHPGVLGPTPSLHSPIPRVPQHQPQLTGVQFSLMLAFILYYMLSFYLIFLYFSCMCPFVSSVEQGGDGLS